MMMSMWLFFRGGVGGGVREEGRNLVFNTHSTMTLILGRKKGGMGEGGGRECMWSFHSPKVPSKCQVDCEMGTPFCRT